MAGLCAPDREELTAIAEELQLHPLAVEDAVTEHQRPKLDRYDARLLLSAYAVRARHGDGPARSPSEIAAFVTPNALVTVRKDDAVRHRRRSSALGRLRRAGQARRRRSCCSGLLDYIVDGHFEAVQSLDDEIEALEDLLFDDRPRDREVQRRSSSCARASCCCGGSCCRCARSSTR